MLKRCYSRNSGATVSQDWLIFSVFQLWYDRQEALVRATGYAGELVLDKDLLCKDGLMYSPDACCLIPRELNNLLGKVGCRSTNKTGYAGVSVLKGGGVKRFRVQPGKGLYFLFSTAAEAYSCRLEYLSERFKGFTKKYSDLLNVQNACVAMASYCSPQSLARQDSFEDMISSVG